MDEAGINSVFRAQ